MSVPCACACTYTVSISDDEISAQYQELSQKQDETIAQIEDVEAKIAETEEKIAEQEAELEEKQFKTKLTVIDTPGFGDYVNNRDSWSPIVDFIDDQIVETLNSISGEEKFSVDDLASYSPVLTNELLGFYAQLAWN